MVPAATAILILPKPAPIAALKYRRLLVTNSISEGIEMNILISVILTLAVLSPPPEITGRIVDDNGRPVSGVPISVVALYASQTVSKTLSGSDGSFHFSDLAAGAYGLSAETDSACAFSDPIRVDVGFTSVVSLRLIKGFCKNAFAILRSQDTESSSLPVIELEEWKGARASGNSNPSRIRYAYGRRMGHGLSSPFGVAVRPKR